MDLTRYFSARRKESHGHSGAHSSDGEKVSKHHLPLLANPINKNVRHVLSGGFSDLEKMNTASSKVNSSNSTSTFGETGRTSRGNIIIYKMHHEAHTIELFYDLFFVANLAYFTAMHQHTDAQSLINYLKLFTLMWFTWLGVTLFDVRFSIDCVWNRIHKAIQFGVFTGFVFAGPVFDKYMDGSDGKSYRTFAIVLVVSRLSIAVQYTVVVWQSRMFKQTLLPLALSAGVHALAAVGYGITIALFPRGVVGLEEQVTWVVIAIAEGLSIFLIAMTWRIVSFKYTHLVERLQLLTLIIIGEGIIGMVKSVACITKGQTTNNVRELGSVAAAVLLLYLLYMLYFDAVSHDRFGTVRQQIWSLLHFPLHSAILLCVEGNTSLIVWNSAVQALQYMWKLQPDNYSDPASGYADTTVFLSYLNTSMYDINARFKSKSWASAYNWDRNLTAIANYTDMYGFKSGEWNNFTGNLTRYMFDSAQVFVFESHADSLAKLNAVTAPSMTPRTKLDSISEVFNTTVMQFYIGAGTMLLTLAAMYWFNKRSKTKREFGEMANRLVVGFTLIVVGVAAVIGNKSTSAFKYRLSHWIIAILVLLLIAIILADNLLLVIMYRTFKRNDHHRGGSWSGSTANDTSDENDAVRLISKYSSQTRTLNPGPMTAPLETVHTAYAPYDSPPREVDFATRVSKQALTTDSDMTLREDTRNRGNVDLSYNSTPISMKPGAPEGLGIARAVSPALSLRSEGYDRSKGGSSKRGYESLGSGEDHGPDGEECVLQHLGRAMTADHTIV